MSKDVLITPASGIIEFKNTANTKAQIELDSANNLIISSTGGDVTIGTPGSNLFVGDGINSVDIIFEQSGAIKALAGKTLTLGQANSFVAVGTSLSVTGNVTGSNLITAGAVTGNGRALTSLNATNLDTGTVPAARLSGTYTITVSGAATTAGTVTTAAQPNITSVGTLSSLSLTGLVTGRSSASTDVNTANDTGSFSARGNTSTVASMSFHRTGAFAINMGLGTDNVFRIGGWSASANCLQLSSTGALTILSTISSGAHTITGSPATAIVNGGTNGVGNIGAAGAGFNTVFAKATSAQYADVAEQYQADADYPPGTVLIIGGAQEVTASAHGHDTAVAGVVSQRPSYLMNAGLQTANSVPVALLGRVPCQVVGTITRGQLLVTSSTPGTATALDHTKYVPGCVIGKALEDYNSNVAGMIEIAVGIK
jgi:hypothetical protein